MKSEIADWTFEVVARPICNFGFAAEEPITKREQVREDIKNQLRTRLKEHDILLDEFDIVNFEFSKIFNEAIEAKTQLAFKPEDFKI